MTIFVRNVNHALSQGFQCLRQLGFVQESRNGPVLRFPGPFVTYYQNPTERVLFNPVRDANPVFHLMESIWMLAGYRHVNWLLDFNSNFSDYAEPETGIQHGAYGYRWKNHFHFDQILEAAKLLRKDPNDRRVVIGMWDPNIDLGMPYRDVPCNTHLYVEVVEGKLNLTICCRSNDIIWGAYGANAVHFSILQEFLARAVGVEVGRMYQFSNNFHAYLENPVVKNFMSKPEAPGVYDLYGKEMAESLPLLAEGEDYLDFLRECDYFVSGQPEFLTCSFLKEAWKLRDAYLLRKVGDPVWRDALASMASCDWKVAFQQWTDRREQA